MIEATVSVSVRVYDEKALYKAAFEDLVNNHNYSEEEANGFFRPDGEIDVSACLRQMIDPGASPAGTEILGSECDAYFSDNKHTESTP